MKVEAIKSAISLLQQEIFDFPDIAEVSFFEGAFNVLTVQFYQGNLDEKLYKEYLSDFIRNRSIERETLSKLAPDILKELDTEIE